MKILCLLLFSQIILANVNFVDRIGVIVEEGIIMESEVNNALEQAIKNLKKNGNQIPPREFLFNNVLEKLIMDEILMQKAKKFGIRISDQELNESLIRIARQEDLNLKEFKEKVEKEGDTFKSFREIIKKEMMIRRVQSGLVRPKIVISEQEIENYINSSEGEELISTEYKIEQILLKFPSNLNEQIKDRFINQAEDIKKEINDGLDFQDAIKKYSDLKEEENFGGIYWKKISEVPSIFEKKLKSMKLNDFFGPIESGAGIHIIKLSGIRGDSIKVEEQSLVQHILIETSEIRSEKQAEDLINNLYDRAQEEDLGILARIYSDDPGSKLNAGKLNWAPEGVYDENFETTIKKVKLGEISRPFKSSFGWHILKVLEKREKNISDEMIKDKAFGILFNRKFNEQLQNTLEEIRSESFVDIKISSS
tara:strand:+ start:1842 stop:3110 length:1269 start_codon:yes stop_codon:yes gene_type:complete